MIDKYLSSKIFDKKKLISLILKKYSKIFEKKKTSKKKLRKKILIKEKSSKIMNKPL